MALSHELSVVSAVDPSAIAAWKEAIGARETRNQHIDIESARRYALAIGSGPDVERTVPPLAHWAFFLPQTEDRQLGVDGHPRRGGFLPPITMPRRMFAAANIVFEAPLILDANAEMVSHVVDIVHKSGTTGDLVFAEVDRVISQLGIVRVRERQSYVYRGMGEPLPMPVASEPAPVGDIWHPEAVNLFRFSAATFNSHRIHYDLPYAQGVEGYPALVVHGPFTAAKLAGFAGRDGALASFCFRAHAPLFLDQPIYLSGEAGEFRATRCDGTTAMTAKVTYR